MDFEIFKENVRTWADARGILANGKAHTQVLKGLSEFGELADAIAKDRKGEIKDAIGDITVCLLNAYSLVGSTIKLPAPVSVPDTPTHVAFQAICKEFSTLFAHLPFHMKSSSSSSAYFYPIYGVLADLQSIAENYGLSFQECCEAAWDEIKDRKGYLNSEGVFIKE